MEEASDGEKTRLKQKYREKKNAANKAVAKTRDERQQKWCKKIEEEEAEVRMVGEMYKETTAEVRIEGEPSEQFGVGVGLKQGSASSPLLFIILMNLLRTVSEQEELQKILYADDPAVVAVTKRTYKNIDRSNVDRRTGSGSLGV